MKRTNYKEKITFSIPTNFEISKGLNNDDNDIITDDNIDYNNMIVSGLASNDTKDLQGQILQPSGFILDYFKKTGFINYNHQTAVNPGSIIGEPIETKVTKENLYIKSKLYPWSNLAKEVYKTGLQLQKDKTSDRSLGYSVEGVTLEQENDKVTKLLLTGCALCFTPVNNNTYALICKGITIDEIKELNKKQFFTPIYSEVDKKGNRKEYILKLDLGEQQLLVDTDQNFVYRDNPVFKASNPEEIRKAIVTLAKGVEEGFILEDRKKELLDTLKMRMKNFKLN